METNFGGCDNCCMSYTRAFKLIIRKQDADMQMHPSA